MAEILDHARAAARTVGGVGSRPWRMGHAAPEKAWGSHQTSGYCLKNPPPGNGEDAVAKLTGLVPAVQQQAANEPIGVLLPE